jgi:hypothetical protein
MGTYLATIALIFLLLLAWVVVQQLARLFARRHPQFGAYREGGSCGGGCGHCGDACDSGNGQRSR